MKALGAKHAVLTAKHGCGFLLWPTDVSLPNGSAYEYSVTDDLLQQFTASMDRADIGHGFYYSLTNNFYLNVASHYVQPNSTLLPGQVGVTQDEFEKIALGHVTELWSNYGNLTEIWFDGGYTSDMKEAITALLQEQQPHANAFGGHGLTPNQLRWVGTESGLPSGPLWSTGLDGAGDPASAEWCPAGCDTTLQNGDVWFWTQGLGIRSLEVLKNVYHATVGSNGVLELDFAIDRRGKVDDDHAARYKEFGDWIRSCYGTPIASAAFPSANASQVDLDLGGSATTVDRVMLQEDQTQGQRIRAYSIEAFVDGAWTTVVAEGTAVGNKRIDIFDAPVAADTLRLTVTEAADSPVLKTFAAFAPCDE